MFSYRAAVDDGIGRIVAGTFRSEDDRDIQKRGWEIANRFFVSLNCSNKVSDISFGVLIKRMTPWMLSEQHCLHVEHYPSSQPPTRCDSLYNSTWYNSFDGLSSWVELSWIRLQLKAHLHLTITFAKFFFCRKVAHERNVRIRVIAMQFTARRVVMSLQRLTLWSTPQCVAFGTQAQKTVLVITTMFTPRRA